MCGVQSRKLDQLEEENVRLENQLEQKQLDWETRDVELEELQVNEIIYAAETYAFKRLNYFYDTLLITYLFRILQDELEEGKQEQMRSKQQRSKKEGFLKKDGLDQSGGIPNPDLPLSQQLEQSLDTVKSHSQNIKVHLESSFCYLTFCLIRMCELILLHLITFYIFRI